ncbi:MAG TPA: hypothetical protein PLF26_10380 [Blastocatellia bacterium]|nr:hypothetical protein [Blastocatellia bacterium]
MRLVSAKLTLILYIMVCFEIGFLLIFLPWHRTWQENNFLYYIAETLSAPRLLQIVGSGYVRGAVTGLGIINILIGIREIVNFPSSVRAIGGEDEPLSDH